MAKMPNILKKKMEEKKKQQQLEEEDQQPEDQEDSQDETLKVMEEQEFLLNERNYRHQQLLALRLIEVRMKEVKESVDKLGAVMEDILES